jgi:threonine/homoserine/homoserine lactone efflux protein
VHLTSFLALSALLIVAPGPDMALVARNALRGGARAGILTSLGGATGLLIWTLASSVGVAALIRASEPAFLALKAVGAAYLVFLGVQALRTVWRPRPGEAPRRAAAQPRHSYRQGLLNNLGNPKIAVFFTSFLPQFVPSGSSSFTTLLALGLVFCVMTLAWLVSYSLVVAKAGDVLRRPRVQLVVEAITGVVLIGFGVKLATEHR